MIRGLAILAFASCTITSDLTVAGELPVGQVYECRAVDRSTEWCWPGDVEEIERELGAACRPTPRHVGPCLYSCRPTHRGCNALSGCWCPSGDEG